MNTIIIYASKSGATKACADILAKEFSGSVLCDIQKNTPSLDAYDTILIGSGVRMGKIYKPIKSFIRNNLLDLLSKKTAIYICNAYPDTTQKTIDKNIPEELKNATICIESFGGTPPFTSNTDNHTWIKRENIMSFVQVVKDKCSME